MALHAPVLALLLQSCAPNVAPPTMLAVMQVESRGDPFVIGVNSATNLRRQPTNAADAAATARSLMSRGINFDAGLMQINSANFAALGVSPETVFDPCTNLRAGARVLANNYRRARQSGHAAPLQAALSAYNTGSRSRGLSNGYVGKVYAAAGQGYAPVAALPVVQRSPAAGTSPAYVARVLLNAFGGRITDTVRPMTASYGAENSYHKYAQAVDFVPRGGVLAITRDAVRRVMQAGGIQLIELLGPGDPGHSDHWHVAFGSGLYERPLPAIEAQGPWSVAATSAAQPVSAGPGYGDRPVILAAAAENVPAEPRLVSVSAPPRPPAWDVFGVAAWQRRGGPQ